MFENQTAPAKSGKTIWGLRRLFFTGIMQHVWSCPSISGDHQYVSAQVRPVEAFHIGCCSLTEQPVELRLFQISLFFLYRCNELTTPWLWICQRQVWQLIVRVEIMKWFFSRRHGNVNRRGSSMMEMEGFTGKEPTTMDRDSDSYRWSLTTGQVYNIFNVFDGQLKQSQSLFYVNSCPPLFILCPWQWWW